MATVVFANDIDSVSHAGVEELLAHELKDFFWRDFAGVVYVEMLEEAHRFEVRMSCQVLSTHFNLVAKKSNLITLVNNFKTNYG